MASSWVKHLLSICILMLMTSFSTHAEETSGGIVIEVTDAKTNRPLKMPQLVYRWNKTMR